MSNPLDIARWYKSKVYLPKRGNRKLGEECWDCLPHIRSRIKSREEFLLRAGEKEGFLCIATVNIEPIIGIVCTDGILSRKEDPNYVVLQDYLSPQPTLGVE